MTIWFISDTHGLHRHLSPPPADMIIVGGDISNSRNQAINASEATDFLLWLDSLPYAHKVLIAGNHDVSLESGLVDPHTLVKNLTYLSHSAAQINGIRLFGSPYTPSFGQGWAYNIARHKIASAWASITPCDILITHGPPQGFLDASLATGTLEQAGCYALKKRVQTLAPAYHLFGHIHNNHNLINQGTRTHNNITYINGSIVTDGQFNSGPSSNGILFAIPEKPHQNINP